MRHANDTKHFMPIEMQMIIKEGLRLGGLTPALAPRMRAITKVVRAVNATALPGGKIKSSIVLLN